MQNLDRESPKVVSWTVLTSVGTAITHNYPLPPTAAEATRFVMSIEAVITGVFSGESKLLRLANPMVTYNPVFVVSIAFDSYGQTELDSAVEDRERTTGFQTSSD